MGSFLVSCCATNQSICGEDVYVIPIAENVEKIKNNQNLVLQGLGRLTYNTDLYEPLGFLFTGHYDDYGRYDIDWNKTSNKYMLKKYLSFLKENAVYIEQGENKYHDPAFNPVDLEVEGSNYQAIWEYIHDVIWEGRMFLKRHYYQGGWIYTKVEYFIGHKRNMDILLDLYQERDKTNGYYGNPEEKLFYQKTTEEKALVMFNYFKQEHEEEQSEDYDKLEVLTRRLANEDRMHHFLGESLGSGMNVRWRPVERIRKELVVNRLDNYEDYLDIYKAFVTLKEIVISLSYCNVILRPVYYASQDYGNSFGLRFGHWMEQVHNRNIAENDFEGYLEDNELDNDVELSTKMKKDIVEKDAKSFYY